jgi:hypothetical protein
MISAPELVKRAMKATGATTPTELARTLEMTSYSAPRNVQRWLDGVSAPEYESTLQLLAAAGLLTAEGQKALQGNDPAESVKRAGDAAREAADRSNELANEAPPQRARGKQ